MNPRPARLPIAIPPARHETVASYVTRLARVHRLDYHEFWSHISIRQRPGSPRRLIDADRLAALTGRPLVVLEHALPELRDPTPDWRQLRHLPQHACPACTTRHPGGPVRKLFAHHEFVCTRHGFWIGPAEDIHDHQPRRITGIIPEIAAAQYRHSQLIRRHGWQMTFAAIDASLRLTVDQRFLHRPRLDRWDQRIDRLMPTAGNFSTSLFTAVFYSETVQLAELFCTPTTPGARPRGKP